MNNKDIIQEKSYWDTFYNTWGLDVPSQFCVQTVTDLERGASIVEFGSGNGRDSQYMASQGYVLTAMDLSQSAIQKCTENMQAKNFRHAFFMCGDVSAEEDIERALDHARQHTADDLGLVVYSRFLLHSLDDTQEEHFITALGKHLRPGDRLYLEFRSSADADTPKVFGNHYRRYVDTQNLLELMTSQCGFDVDYAITGQGMARYREEDPVVSRVIATRR